MWAAKAVAGQGAEFTEGEQQRAMGGEQWPRKAFWKAALEPRVGSRQDFPQERSGVSGIEEGCPKPLAGGSIGWDGWKVTALELRLETHCLKHE